MKIEDVTILKGLEPIEIQENPSPRTIEALAKFISNDGFIKMFDGIRAQYQYPTDGLDIKAFVGKNFSKLTAMNSAFLLPSLNIIADETRVRLGLKEDFHIQVLLLLFFNAIIDVDYFDGFAVRNIDAIVSKKKINMALYDYDHEVGAIIIPYSISRNQLDKWLDKNWKKFQDKMDMNISVNPYKIKLHKNTELAVKIKHLKDVEGKTFEEIADELYSESSKTKENERLANSAYIKKLYYDYIQMWQSSNIKPQ